MEEELEHEEKLDPSTSIDFFFSLCSTLPYYIEVPVEREDIRRVLKVNETEDTEAGATSLWQLGFDTQPYRILSMLG